MFDTIMQAAANLSPQTVQLVGTWVAALLTLAVLSYVLGDNLLFRLAQYLLIGTAAGYAAAMAWNSVLQPRLALLLLDPGRYWYYGLFFLFGLGLLARGVRSIAVLSNLPLAVLFGTGAALALGGAISGSLVPQIRATVVSVAPASYGGGFLGWAHAIDALLAALCTLTVLSAFHFTARREGVADALTHGIMAVLGGVGRKVLMVAFGALLAGAFLAFFTILRSRLDFLVHDWLRLVIGMRF